MDPDSYLNLLSPDFNEFDDWFIASQPAEPASFSASHGSFPDTKNPIDPLEKLVSRSAHTSPAFSSVLKLSDIASALEEFSRTSLCSTAPPPPPPAAHDPPPMAGPNQQPPTCTNGQLVHKHSVKRHLVHVLIDDDDNDVYEINDEISEDVKPNLAMASSFSLPFTSLSKQSSSPEKRPKLSQSSKFGLNLNYALETDINLDVGRKCINREGLSQREVHIQSERLRRKSMTDYFTILQSMVPRIKLKHADRITVLTEVIAYIQSLRGTLEELEQKKSDLLTLLGLSEEDYYYSRQNYLSDCCINHKDKRKPNMISDHNLKLADKHAEVTVRISGVDVFVTLNTPKQKGVWSKVLLLLQQYSIEVVNATLATSGENNFHCIHGKVVNISKVGSSDLQEKLEELIVQELNRRPRL